ncbi:MAG: hypothetical protein AB7O97_18365 [Planctomycetota bacterium]
MSVSSHLHFPFSRGAAGALLAIATLALLPATASAQHNWTKAKAYTGGGIVPGGWHRHTVAYDSNDAAIRHHRRSKPNGRSWAEAYQFAQWTWQPGFEGTVGAFYSCGYAKVKGWAADYEYKFRDLKFIAGDDDPSAQEACPPPGGDCDCECDSLVVAFQIGSVNSTAVTVGAGSHLRVDPQNAAGAVSAAMFLEVVEQATGATIATGEIRLDYDAVTQTPVLVRSGVLQSAPVAIQPTPLGQFVVDLSSVSYSLPFGPATHAIHVGGAAVGSEATAGVSDSPIGLDPVGTADAPAGSLTFFDLDVRSPNGVTVRRLDVNTGATAANTLGTVEVYATPATYAGNQQSPGAWTLVASGPVLATGSDQPSPACLGAGFHLPFGSHGIAVRHLGVALRHTAATAQNQVAETDDLVLRAGQCQVTPFASVPVPGCLFSGNLHYELGNAPGAPCDPFAMAVPVGVGCGSFGPLHLSVPARPVLGSTLALETTNLGFNPTLGIVVLGFTPIPGLPLDSLGMPGCFLYQSLDMSFFLAAGPSSMVMPLTLPEDPFLIGAIVRAQSAVRDPMANPLGLSASNGISLQLSTH